MTREATTAGLGQMHTCKAAKGSRILQGKVTCRVSQAAIGSVPPSSCCVLLEAKSCQTFEFLA